MRPLAYSLVLVLPAFALLASPAASAAPRCPRLDPGKSLGALAVGLAEADLHAKNHPVVPGVSERHLRVGAFEVWLDGGRVATVAADSTLVPCIRVADRDIQLAETPLEALGALFPGRCSPISANEGATVVACDNGVTFAQHLAGLSVQVAAPAAIDGPRCHRWVQPGAAAKSPLAVAEVKPGELVCAGLRAFSADLTPDDILPIGGRAHISTCRRQDNRGATLVDCTFDGLRLVFAGPTLHLARVEAIPVATR